MSTWEFWPLGTKRPANPVLGRGRTAREAWEDAWPRLRGLGFCEVVSRRVTSVTHEPVAPPKRRLGKEVQA